MSLLKNTMAQVLREGDFTKGGKQVDLLVGIKEVDAKGGKMLVSRAASDVFDAMGIPGEFWIEVSKAGKEIKVDPEKAKDADFVGNSINGKMAEYFAMFAKEGGHASVILEKMVVYPGQGTAEKPFPVRWINNIPGGNANKVLSGKVTVSGYYDGNATPMLAKLQLWSPQAVNMAQLESVRQVFDDSAKYSADSRAAYEADPDDKSYPVKHAPAVAFVAIADGKVVDFSPTLSYHPIEKRIINGQEVIDSAKEYAEMVAESYPGAVVQAVLAKEYQFSRGTMAHGALLTMMNTKGPFSVDGGVPRNGNSVLAAQAVVTLSPGKLLPSGQRKGERNDFVMNVYAGGAVGSVLKGHVFEGLLDAGGNKLTVHDSLSSMTYPNRPAGQSEAANDQTATPRESGEAKPQSTGGAAEAKDPLDEDAAIDAALAKAAQSKGGTSASM